MKRYRVEIRETEIGVVYVDAISIEQAKLMAEAVYHHGDIDWYHSDIEVDSVVEVNPNA
jgi:hypothetical protein